LLTYHPKTWGNFPLPSLRDSNIGSLGKFRNFIRFLGSILTLGDSLRRWLFKTLIWTVKVHRNGYMAQNWAWWPPPKLRFFETSWCQGIESVEYEKLVRQILRKSILKLMTCQNGPKFLVDRLQNRFSQNLPYQFFILNGFMTLIS
jgi:hypothetical protein